MNPERASIPEAREAIMWEIDRWLKSLSSQRSRLRVSSLLKDDLVDELRRLANWLLATEPVRVLISSSHADMQPERRLLISRIEQLPNVEVVAREKDQSVGADEVDRAEWLPWAVGRSDVVLFLTDSPRAASGPEPDRFLSLTRSMTEISLAHKFRKRSLAYSLVRPFPDDASLLPQWDGDLDSLRSARREAETGPRSEDTRMWVLQDRDRRLIRDAWRGEIKTVEALGDHLVADVGWVATRLQWLRRVRRFLALAMAVLLAVWLVVRLGFLGAVLVLGVAGIAYLWHLERRWRRPELWWHREL